MRGIYYLITLLGTAQQCSGRPCPKETQSAPEQVCHASMAVLVDDGDELPICSLKVDRSLLVLGAGEQHWSALCCSVLSRS
jgi:hypothetical protein